METKTRKIIKLIAIVVAWVLCAIIPQQITHSPPFIIAIRAIILTIPMWIFGRQSSNQLLRIVWGFCDQCLNMVMAFEFASTFVGLLGLMLGLMVLGAISSIWSICAFCLTIFEFIKKYVLAATNEEVNASGAEEVSAMNDTADAKSRNESSNGDRVIYID